MTADQLRERRERAGLTQVELARLTGLRQATICNIERGRCKPRRSTLRLINLALHAQKVTTKTCAKGLTGGGVTPYRHGMGDKL